MKTLYITPQGKVSHNPDMEMPEESSCYKTLAKTAEQRELCRDTIHCACDAYDSALQRYKDGCLEFEDQERMKQLACDLLDCDCQVKCTLKPDTFLQVDFPAFEVVRQFRKYDCIMWGMWQLGR